MYKKLNIFTFKEKCLWPNCYKFLKQIYRCLQFNDRGDVLYGGGTNYFGVFSVEPTKIYDTVTTKWGNLNEFVVKDNKIVS